MGLRWISSFRTGIPVMDDDHKTLINVIRLLRLVLLDRAPVAAGTLISVLSSFLHEHFRREEELIGRTAFTAIESHRIVHNDSAQPLGRLRVAILANRYAAALDALGELECWMIEEIVGADLSFASYVEYYDQGQCLTGLPRLSSMTVIGGN